MSAPTPTRPSLWEPNDLAALPRWADWTLAAVLLSYALLGVGFSTTAEKISVVLGLTATALFFRGRPALRRSPAFWLLGGALAIALASWGYAHLTDPAWAERSPRVHRVTNWLFPIAVAYALGGRTRNTLVMLGAALAGLLAGIVKGGGFGTIATGLAGTRVDFGLHNAQHAALYCGVALIGLAALLPRLLGLVQGRPARYWPLIALWLALVAGLGAGLAVTQTRAAWIGLFCALALLAWLARGQFRRHRGWLIATFVILGAGALLSLKQTNLLEQRFIPELETLTAKLSGHSEQMAFDSTGIRLRTWSDALDWVAAKPLLGWGGNGRSLVMEKTPGYPDWLRASTRHLHSAYVDTLVNYGVAGLALLLGLWGWLLAAAHRACRQGLLPPDLLHFFTAFMLYWAIVNGFESYIYFNSGNFVFAIVAGAVLTHIWRSPAGKAPATPQREPRRQSN
jgi:O-antigen ligase